MKKLLLLSLSILISVAVFSQKEGKIKVEGDTPADTSSIIVKPNRIDLYSPGVYWNDELLGTGDGNGTSLPDLFFYILTDSYDADEEAATGSDDYMFADAFTQSDVIYIPYRETPYLIKTELDIPPGKTLMFFRYTLHI